MTHAPSRRRAVAWVTHFLPYPANGHGALQRTHHLMRRVAEHFDVHLFTLSNEPHAHAQALTLGVQSAVVRPVPTGAMRLFRAAGSLAGRFSIWDALFFNRSLHVALQAFCSRHQPIVIVDTIFLQRYLDDLQAGPIVINHHNIESHLLRQRGGRPSFACRADGPPQRSNAAAIDTYRRSPYRQTTLTACARSCRRPASLRCPMASTSSTSRMVVAPTGRRGRIRSCLPAEWTGTPTGMPWTG